VQIDELKIRAAIQLMHEALDGAAPPQPVPTAEPERKLSSPELAAAYGVSQRTVQYWRERGCPCTRLSGRIYRYDLEEVQAWHAAQPTVVMLPPKRKA
jgi:hypothetical protein